MPLTTDDLNQIKTIVTDTVTGIVADTTSGLATKADLTHVESSLTTKIARVESSLNTKIDRLESRVVTAINLLQRDSFDRLDDHKARLAKLEQGRASA